MSGKDVCRFLLGGTAVENAFEAGFLKWPLLGKNADHNSTIVVACFCCCDHGKYPIFSRFSFAAAKKRQAIIEIRWEALFFETHKIKSIVVGARWQFLRESNEPSQDQAPSFPRL